MDAFLKRVLECIIIILSCRLTFKRLLRINYDRLVFPRKRKFFSLTIIHNNMTEYYDKSDSIYRVLFHTIL